MQQLTKLAIIVLCASLTGCYGNSLCGDYRQIPELDRNNDGLTDYKYQIIGDSILAYYNITCESVGHHLGFELNDRVQTLAATGAKIAEIQAQYQPPVDAESDFEYVIVNGGLNDILANKNEENPESPACDCNGTVNHDACLAEVDYITSQILGLIDSVKATSNADVALVTYYPAEDTDSFIGECFPYVEILNNKYRALADSDPKVHAIETYGAGQQVIPKVNILGQDKYHPAPEGSELIALQIKEQLGLQGETELQE